MLFARGGEKRRRRKKRWKELDTAFITEAISSELDSFLYTEGLGLCSVDTASIVHFTLLKSLLQESMSFCGAGGVKGTGSQEAAPSGPASSFMVLAAVVSSYFFSSDQLKGSALTGMTAFGSALIAYLYFYLNSPKKENASFSWGSVTYSAFSGLFSLQSPYCVLA